MRPLLIAIHGTKGSGKDLTAKMLMKYIRTMSSFAFATKLKEICSVIYNVPLPTFYEEAAKEVPIVHVGKTPRAMMTEVADMCRSAMGDDFFAKRIIPVWSSCFSLQHSVVVTDLRHAVELKIIEDLGGIILHVLRPPTGLYSDYSHISEKGLTLKLHHRVIDNSRDKAYLLEQVRNVIRDLWGPDVLKPYPFTPKDVLEF